MFYSATTTLPPAKDDPLRRKRKTKLLSNTIHPEEKRRIIGDTFMRIANEMIEELNLRPEDVYLGQGARVFFSVDLRLSEVKYLQHKVT